MRETERKGGGNVGRGVRERRGGVSESDGGGENERYREGER